MSIKAARAGSSPAILSPRDGRPKSQLPSSGLGKDVVKIQKGDHVRNAAKTVGTTAGGAILAGLGTVGYDVFFHWGNNGGTAYGNKVYLSMLAIGAAIGLGFGIFQFWKKQK